MTAGDLVSKAGTAISQVPVLGPMASSAGSAGKAAFGFAASGPGMAYIAGAVLAAAIVKTVVESKVQTHLCKEQCAEKFLLDPEKRWRCQQSCIKELKAFKSRDKYKNLRKPKEGFSNEKTK